MIFQYALKEFDLGAIKVNLMAFFDEKTLNKLALKFPEDATAVALRELVRYLFLCAYSDTPVFFPGNKLMDDIWHALITETATYRAFCDKLRSGTFLDHSGMTFKDYLQKFGNEKVHEEQCSWLVSYIKNFGHIDEEAFSCLTLAQSLSDRMGLGLLGINTFGENLLSVVSNSSLEKEKFNFNSFLIEVEHRSSEIDENPHVLALFIRKLFRSLGSLCGDKGVYLTDSELEGLFSVSTALAFVTWQHLAALERLSGQLEWQDKNADVWSRLKSGQSLCGLATTHLGKPGGGGIKAVCKSTHYLLNGKADWVCGAGIFDMLLIGFELGESIVFCLVNFPRSTSAQAIIENKSLICLNGSATAAIIFADFKVLNESVIYSRLKSEAVKGRPSEYSMPELGIALGALKHVENLCTTSSHPKNKHALDAVFRIHGRIISVKERNKSNVNPEELLILRDEIIRDSVRLLCITTGANTLNKKSLAGRLQLEILLLDSVIQSPTVLVAKINKIANG